MEVLQDFCLKGGYSVKWYENLVQKVTEMTGHSTGVTQHFGGGRF